jgi:hypothetical protein
VRLSALCVVVLALVPACSFAAGIVIHVPGDAATIQAGINAAQAADTVFVACGTYYEHDIQVKPGVCLMSADYHLCANSPCLSDQNGCHVRTGAYDAGCGDCDSAVEHTSWGAIKALYR